MNGEIKFKSLQELYTRILPALKSKTKEFKKNGLLYIHEEDIWNFLKTYKWINSRDLDLGCMVNDIFSVDAKEIDTYVKNMIKEYHRDIEQEEI